MLGILRKEFPGLEIGALSIGKHKNSPFLNEDGYVITKNTFAVIDGSAPRVDLKFNGKSTARFRAFGLLRTIPWAAERWNGVGRGSSQDEQVMGQCHKPR